MKTESSSESQFTPRWQGVVQTVREWEILVLEKFADSGAGRGTGRVGGSGTDKSMQRTELLVT